jgi:type IV pilus assembly protein PilB
LSNLDHDARDGAGAKGRAARVVPAAEADDVPRPPDFSTSGLGAEADLSVAARKASATRIRPQDALRQIGGPTVEEGAIVRTDDLGEILVSRGVITSEQLTTAQRVMRQTPGKRLSEVLVELSVDEEAIQSAVAQIARLPFERIIAETDDAFDTRALHKLGLEYCRANQVIPLRREGNRLVVGTVRPDDVFLLDDVKRRLNCPFVKHVLVTGYDIRGVVELLTETGAEEIDVGSILANVDEDDVEVVKEDQQDAAIEDAESSPVVRYVNHIIQSALKEGASDIHIEPDEKSLRVRFRIDGILFEMMTPPRKMHAALTSRIKIMANLDIAEKRLPQDGRIRATVLGRKLDLRVSTIPTPKGEKTVMRILDTRSLNVALEELGFADDTLMMWRNQIALPHGILLVTGPTGSGKTTTLYASIRQMDLRRLNVCTVEDPVEYNLSGITQVQTHDRIGLSFGSCLRSMLRQDPDVIMVGEIRDMETATIAIQASLTGHLVLSTLHTNDAPSSITRLINIGIEPFLVGAAVNSVLAQRLVRRLCGSCGESAPVKDEIREFLSMHGIMTDTIMEGRGCSKCRETGYSGRVGLYELLLLDDHTRDAVARSPSVTEFRRVCSERGMRTLREDGFTKVARGLTSVEEILRVTESTI